MSAVTQLPDFIYAGPPRSGSTWLDQVLRGHAGLPRRIKETRFFTTNYHRGIDWYRAHFAGYPPGLPLGEVTTYFDHQEVRERIHAHIPECRIICTLRDPVKRIWSHYCQLRHEGWIGRRTLAEALAAHEKWIDTAGNLIGLNRYAYHLGEWQRYFGEQRVMVTIFDDLEADPQQFLDHICDFIGLARIDLERSPVGGAAVNKMTHAPRSPHLARRVRRLRQKMQRRGMYRLVELCEPLFEFCFSGGEPFGRIDPATEKALRARFRPEVEALERLIGRDLTAWKG
ncbi:MAG TPA: sulfotransferase [Candidatus Binataceae bacterium]|jgi:hypothetical protein|nr:sulfotransferase [Candidatus Binataceae bacterium]